jgi:predicted RNase H-like nuclease (RuvC/YqgF family)
VPARCRVRFTVPYWSSGFERTGCWGGASVQAHREEIERLTQQLSEKGGGDVDLVKENSELQMKVKELQAAAAAAPPAEAASHNVDEQEQAWVAEKKVLKEEQEVLIKMMTEKEEMTESLMEKVAHLEKALEEAAAGSGVAADAAAAAARAQSEAAVAAAEQAVAAARAEVRAPAVPQSLREERGQCWRRHMGRECRELFPRAPLVVTHI